MIELYRLIYVWTMKYSFCCEYSRIFGIVVLCCLNTGWSLQSLLEINLFLSHFGWWETLCDWTYPLYILLQIFPCVFASLCKVCQLRNVPEKSDSQCIYLPEWFSEQSFVLPLICHSTPVSMRYGRLKKNIHKCFWWIICILLLVHLHKYLHILIYLKFELYCKPLCKFVLYCNPISCHLEARLPKLL